MNTRHLSEASEPLLKASSTRCSAKRDKHFKSWASPSSGSATSSLKSSSLSWPPFSRRRIRKETYTIQMMLNLCLSPMSQRQPAYPPLPGRPLISSQADLIHPRCILKNVPESPHLHPPRLARLWISQARLPRPVAVTTIIAVKPRRPFAHVRRYHDSPQTRLRACHLHKHPPHSARQPTALSAERHQLELAPAAPIGLHIHVQTPPVHPRQTRARQSERTERGTSIPIIVTMLHLLAERRWSLGTAEIPVHGEDPCPNESLLHEDPRCWSAKLPSCPRHRSSAPNFGNRLSPETKMPLSPNLMLHLGGIAQPALDPSAHHIAISLPPWGQYELRQTRRKILPLKLR